MALQTSGPISLNDIHVEAGGGSGTLATINDADIRGLINKTSATTMSFSEWYGATAAPPNINFSTAAGEAGWNSAAATGAWSFIAENGLVSPSRSGTNVGLKIRFPGPGEPVYYGYMLLKSAITSQLPPSTNMRVNWIHSGVSNEERMFGRFIIGNVTNLTGSTSWDNFGAGNTYSFTFTTPASGEMTFRVEATPSNYINTETAWISQIWWEYI